MADFVMSNRGKFMVWKMEVETANWVKVKLIKFYKW